MTVGHWETCPTCNGTGVVQPEPLVATYDRVQFVGLEGVQIDDE